MKSLSPFVIIIYDTVRKIVEFRSSTLKQFASTVKHKNCACILIFSIYTYINTRGRRIIPVFSYEKNIAVEKEQL